MDDVHDLEADATARRRLIAAMADARRRVAAEPPFSPSWDAAMAALEELERGDLLKAGVARSDTALVRKRNVRSRAGAPRR
jgi:hypothetical protein